MGFICFFQSRQHLPAAAVALVFVFSAGLSRAQITPLADTYIDSTQPTTNFGSGELLLVFGTSQVAYVQFDLSSIPPGASISQATLKLYVNSVTAGGVFDVWSINQPWTESTIDAFNAPLPQSVIVSNVSITTADVNQYILIDVTSTVQAWLNGSVANNGIALSANDALSVAFDSKENTSTSHPPELDIAFASGNGTISGVTTASGSGLTGGGSSGTLSLGLTTACAANQVLQWNGSAWACSNAGTGTITGVTAGSGLTGGGTTGTLNLGLTNACATNQVLEWNGSAWACSNAATGTITGVTAGTGLTGGGSGGNVTLKLNTKTLDSTYAQLGAENTFKGNQGVTGDVTVSGSVGVGTRTPLASLDVFAAAGQVHAPLAQAGSAGVNDCNSIRTYNASGITEIFQGTTGCFVPGAQAGDGGLRVDPGKNLLLGDSQTLRARLDSEGNASQPPTAGGWAKAMLFFSPFDSGRVVNCYNSTLTGAAATTPPCGFKFDITGHGDYLFDLGFPIVDRFLSLTSSAEDVPDQASYVVPVISLNACTAVNGDLCNNHLTPNQVEVTSVTGVSCGQVACYNKFADTKLFLIVY
jgi:hypothetical protein